MPKESTTFSNAMNHHTPPAITLALLLCLPAAAQQKVAPAMELVSPVPAGEQKGVIEVRIRTGVVGKPAPSSVYASLGGSPGVRMTRSGDSDEWGCQIDTTRTPNGGQQLRVITENKSVLAVPLTVNNPLRHYFADLHSHTSFSDGTLLPEVAHDYARNVAKLDVFSLTDHLEAVDTGEWNRTQEVAWKANEDGAFVVLPGLEWTKAWGHINILDPGTRHWPADPPKFYEAIAAAGVVAKFNHPGDGTKSHAGLEYSEAGDKAIQLMEVRNATEENAFIRALGLGWHIAPDGSDDTHSPNWGNVKTWTGILAPGLSRSNIWDALRNRHCYSTQDRNCRLYFEVCGAVMGDIVGKPVEAAEVRVAVEDPDAADKVAKIELFEDGKVVESHEPADGGGQWTVNHQAAPGSHHYFVKVTQADGNLLWSAPVWVTVAAQNEAVPRDGVPLVTGIPPELIEGTPKPIKAPDGSELPRLVPVPDGPIRFLVPQGTTLLSKGKKVTSSDDNPIIGTLDLITDGEKDAGEGHFVELLDGTQWVQIDLEKSDAIYAICVWHFHSQRRAYHDVIIQISNDFEFKSGVTTVYNNDYDDSSKMGMGSDPPYVESHFGMIVDGRGTKGRYVRLYSNGNTSNVFNHYTEVEVFGGR